MKARDWLAFGAAVATVALTAAAFWLSYEHLHDVSARNGLSGSRAWAWPATIDLFIAVGELLQLRASLLMRGVDWWAVCLIVVGSGGSIALNVAGVGGNSPGLAYVVAAVPPVAALLAFGALMRQVHERLAAVVEDVPEADFAEEIREVPAPPVLEVERETYPPVPVELERVPVPVLAAVEPRTRVSVPVPDAPEDELIARTRTDFPGIPTYRELRERYGIGQARAKRIRAVLEEDLLS